MDTVEKKILEGAIDTHVHFGPDTPEPRRFDAFETAALAEKAGMRAIVLKNHSFMTAALASCTEKRMEHLKVFGGICLDKQAGGLCPEAVEFCADLGGKVVWMPTFTAKHDIEKRGMTGDGIYILDKDNKLKAEVQEIIEIMKERDLVLATGHLSFNEIRVLAVEGRRKGLEKIVVTHPCTQRVGPTLDLDQQKELVELGCYMEHCFVSVMPMHCRFSPQVFVDAIRYVGADRCIMASDFGQTHNPEPPEGLRMFAVSMLKLGITEQEIDLMIRKNPATLLGLD
jgi:hypothetical protein